VKFKEGELKMKKLLVLLMVLGLASSAQASLSITLGAGTIGIGETTSAVVSSSNSDNWQGYIVLSEDQVNWYDPIAASFDGSWSFHTTAGAGCVGDKGLVSMYSVGVYELDAVGTAPAPEAGDQFSRNIIGVQAGTIYVGLQDLSYVPIEGTLQTLVVTPEPMTLALLGLGGLFLRRRK